MRIDLRDGQWADLRERITHGTDKHLKVTVRKGREDDASAFDIETELIRAFAREWDIKDPDGKAIPIGDPDAVERLPDDIADIISTKAGEVWLGATLPNAATPNSSDA